MRNSTMIRPLPIKQISKLPCTGKHPDPQRVEDLSRLGDEITEMAAHLARISHQR